MFILSDPRQESGNVQEDAGDPELRDDRPQDTDPYLSTPQGLRLTHTHTHTHRARLGVRCGYILLDITTATLIIVSATNHCQVKSFKRCFILPQNKLKQKAAVYPD